MQITIKHEDHIKRILELVNHRLPEKYRRGAIEHGGFIGDIHLNDLMDEIIYELLDLIVYVETLKEKLELMESVNIPELVNEFPPKMKNFG